MDSETREYLEALRHEFAAMREEMGARFRAVDSRFDRVDARLNGMDSRLDGVDSRFDTVDSRFDAVDRRIEVEHETTRRHFDVATEALRHEIQTVAEGVLSNTRAIGELRSDVYRDMNAGFGLFHLAFIDVRRQLAELLDPGAGR
jgi:archaellum component FlaC